MLRAWAMLRCSLAGLLAALGPVLGRLASLAPDRSLQPEQLSSPHAGAAPDAPAWLVPVLCSLGVALCNLGMWALQVSGMGSLPSLQATVVNSGSNIACSGLLGWLLLGERVGARWLAGIGLIGAGVACIAAGSGEEEAGQREHEDKKEL